MCFELHFETKHAEVELNVVTRVKILEKKWKKGGNFEFHKCRVIQRQTKPIA